MEWCITESAAAGRMVAFPEAPVALEAFQEVDRSRGRDTVVSARHILYVCNFYKLYEKYGGDLDLEESHEGGQEEEGGD